MTHPASPSPTAGTLASGTLSSDLRGHRLWAPQAWLTDGNGWARNVLLSVDHRGHWDRIETDVPAPADAEVLAGPLLPSMVNAHSHAFQRAFAGLTETREGAHDDFWSWRQRMYRAALRITPEQMKAIATQLYAELVRGGYTQVCEFHYLHLDPDGQPYADGHGLAEALVAAADDVGIGLTLLPVLYQRSGFGQTALSEQQRRFASPPGGVLGLARRVGSLNRPLIDAGVAIHSLRAASPDAIRGLRQEIEQTGFDGPIHIHIAEQQAEVDDCLTHTGLRPIEWLVEHVPLDRRWHLVHATHATESEIDAVSQREAGVVICPSTEANLGDGLCDLNRWLQGRARISIGSDSHATRSWREELRLLEYGQRLHLEQRNVAADPSAGMPSTAARLFTRGLAGGAAAAGMALWGLQAGARADALVMDLSDPALLGIPDRHLLDAAVFSSPSRPFRDVLIAGRWVQRDHRQPASEERGQAFVSAMHTLWQASD